MTFEFLIACHPVPGTNIKQILTDLLIEALDSNSNESDDFITADMIQFRHGYSDNEFIDNDGVRTSCVLIGFALDLPDEIESIRAVVDDFAVSLPETSPIYHVVKFEDPLFKEYLAERAAEIFDLEMKLRRVLSIIYLNSYQGEEPFKLLRDEGVRPLKKTKEQMETAIENQFFYLLFRHYRDLNQCSQLTSRIESKDGVDLIADLKDLIEPIEDMRNCVAHNRRPTDEITESYPNALQILDGRLDQYLVNLPESA